MIAASNTQRCSLARLDLVALVVAKAWVLCRAERIAGAGRHAGVALADLPGVFVVLVALATEVCGHLDAGAAHPDFRSVRIRHMLSSEGTADVEGTISSSITKNRLILNVDLLVVVELGLGCKLEASRGRKGNQGNNQELPELHCSDQS